MAPPETRLPFRTKLAYGVGQMTEGIKTNAFNTFLFFYYNQVLGLSGSRASLALLLALLLDAVTDPVAGSISDRHTSRWGRRHPFMYAAAVPVAIAFALLFHPPSGLDQDALFLWLVTFTVGVRVAMTLFHVPHLALGAELSSDYLERTQVTAYRSFFALIGAMAASVLGFFVFLRPSAAYPEGQFDPGGYGPMGICFGLMMGMAVLATAAGTHSRIPRLHTPPVASGPWRVGSLVPELREALSIRNFRLLCVVMFLAAIMSGVHSVLGVHMGTYFWELGTDQIGLVAVLLGLGTVAGVPAWALMARRFDKKPTLITGVLWSATFASVPPLVKLAGWLPPPDDPIYFPLVCAVSFLSAFGFSAALVTGGSMMADVTDEHELRYGSRREGIFFAAISFVGKSITGLGQAVAGFGLDAIRFPARVSGVPGDAPSPDAIAGLGLLYAGVGIFGYLAVWALTRYRLGPERAREIREALAARGVPGEPAVGPSAASAPGRSLA